MVDSNIYQKIMGNRRKSNRNTFHIQAFAYGNSDGTKTTSITLKKGWESMKD